MKSILVPFLSFFLFFVFFCFLGLISVWFRFTFGFHFSDGFCNEKPRFLGSTILVSVSVQFDSVRNCVIRRIINSWFLLLLLLLLFDVVSIFIQLLVAALFPSLCSFPFLSYLWVLPLLSSSSLSSSSLLSFRSSFRRFFHFLSLCWPFFFFFFLSSFRGRRSTDSVRHSLPFCPGILLAEFFDGLWWSLMVFDGLSMVEGSFSSSPVDSSRFRRARSTIRRTTLRDAPPSESSGIDRLDSFSLEIRTRSIIHLTWLGLTWLR